MTHAALATNAPDAIGLVIPAAMILGACAVGAARGLARRIRTPDRPKRHTRDRKDRR